MWDQPTYKSHDNHPDGADVGLNAFSAVTPQVPPEFGDRGSKLFNVFTVNGLPFTRAGIYTVNVFGNDRRLDGFDVAVVQAPPPFVGVQ